MLHFSNQDEEEPRWLVSLREDQQQAMAKMKLNIDRAEEMVQRAEEMVKRANENLVKIRTESVEVETFWRELINEEIRNRMKNGRR